MPSNRLVFALLPFSLCAADRVEVTAIDDTLGVNLKLPGLDGTLSLTLPEVINDGTRRIVYTDTNLKQVSWQKQPDGSISSSWRKPGLAAYELSATPSSDGLLIKWTITNLEQAPWRDSSGNICMRSKGVKDLFDPTGERTFLRSQGKWVPVRDAWDQRGNTWFMPPGLEPLEIMRPHLASGDWKMGRLRPDEGIIAVQSADGRTVIAQAWHKSRYLIANIKENYACTESPPYFGDIGPGETLQATAMIYCLRGGLADLESKYRADLKSGRIALSRKPAHTK